MSYKNQYVILCRETSLDASDNMLSLVKIVDRFRIAPQYDEDVSNSGKEAVVVPISFSIVTSWYYDDAKTSNDDTLDVQVTKIILNGAGDEVVRFSSPLTLAPRQARFNTREQVNGLPLKGYGSYRLKVQLRKGEVLLGENTIPFDVVKQ